jgi:hypothetical protein
VHTPEDDIVDVETCQGSNINLKLHQEPVFVIDCNIITNNLSNVRFEIFHGGDYDDYHLPEDDNQLK